MRKQSGGRSGGGGSRDRSGRKTSDAGVLTRARALGHAQALAPQVQASDLLANIPQIVWSFDPKSDRPLYVSPVAYQMCGAEVEMPVPCLDWILVEERDPVHAAWQRALGGEMAQAEARACNRDGTTRWFRWLFHPCLDESGMLLRIDGVMEDVSERRELSDRLEKLTTTDGLTGLPNRTLFRDRLAQAIGMARRDSGRGAVVMMMDLDHFKEVNDTLGHQCGDRVLVEVARRISGTLRGTDTVTRLGGDEFAMLLSDTVNSQRTAEKVAGKLLAELARPFSLDGRELSLGASMGIVTYPEHGEDVDTLLGRADIAMYACKGRDARYLFYDDTLNSNTPQRLQLTAEIRRSIERGELVLHYQPIASLRDRRIIGVEALIRWNHPERGLVAPDDFVPLAERSGLIKPITDWVIETALTQASAWRLCGLPLRVSVNVSGRVFRDPFFLGRVESLLSVAGADPGSLEIEVTENVLMSEVEEVARALAALSRLGVRAAIDDFGIGYTSLAYLKRLPIDRLKIDKSLVREMSDDEADSPIVKAIIDLAHNLGREVVAEGVESKDVRAMLDVLGCDAIQGFHLSKPLPAAEIEPWLRAYS